MIKWHRVAVGLLGIGIVIGAIVVYNSVPWYCRVMEIDKIDSNYPCTSQVIAIIDTGINERQLKSYDIIATYNSIDGSNNVSDDNGHGSAITGIICNDTKRKKEFTNSSVNLIIVKAADESGRMTMQSLEHALKYLAKQEVDVINISLGGYVYNSRIDLMLKELYDKGVSIVAASGDHSEKDLLFPASLEYVLSVAALSRDMTINELSNIDNSLICAFPGVDILSVDSSDCKQKTDGTSEATALASLYVAKLKGVYEYETGKQLNEEQVKKYLIELNSLSGGDINYVAPFNDITGKGLEECNG